MGFSIIINNTMIPSDSFGDYFDICRWLFTVCWTHRGTAGTAEPGCWCPHALTPAAVAAVGLFLLLCHWSFLPLYAQASIWREHNSEAIWKTDILEKLLHWCNEQTRGVWFYLGTYGCTSVSVRRAAASWPDVAGLPLDEEEKSLPWSSARSSGI